VHIPSNGQPLARYEEARAEIEARGDGAFVSAPRFGLGNFFARLFGGGAEEDDSEAAPPPPKKQWGLVARRGRGAPQETETTDEGASGESKEIARAEADLPRGETVMRAPDAEVDAETNTQGDARGQRAKAPRPPSRPTFLSARLTTNDAPVAPDRALSLAALGNNATSEEASDELAPAAMRRGVKAPTPPRRPATMSTSRSEKAASSQKAPTVKALETTTRRESKGAPRPTLQFDGSGVKDVGQKKTSPKPSLAQAPRGATSGASTTTTRPVTVAPLGGLRAAAKGTPPDGQ